VDADGMGTSSWMLTHWDKCTDAGGSGMSARRPRSYAFWRPRRAAGALGARQVGSAETKKSIGACLSFYIRTNFCV
jgi:hypothetical protein